MQVIDGRKDEYAPSPVRGTFKLLYEIVQKNGGASRTLIRQRARAENARLTHKQIDHSLSNLCHRGHLTRDDHGMYRIAPLSLWKSKEHIRQAQRESNRKRYQKKPAKAAQKKTAKKAPKKAKQKPRLEPLPAANKDQVVRRVYVHPQPGFTHHGEFEPEPQTDLMARALGMCGVALGVLSFVLSVLSLTAIFAIAS